MDPDKAALAARSKREDQRLVALVLAGDCDAFAALVHKYESRMYHHCLTFLRSPEEAEDALQETFLQSYRALESFRGEAAFSTWLFRIATNACLMRIRKTKRVDLVSIDEPIKWDGSEIKREIVDWSKNPSALYGAKELTRTLEEALQELPEDKRLVITLKDVEGFTNQEIADMLEISLAAVKSRLHRARLAMREELTHRFVGVRSGEREEAL